MTTQQEITFFHGLESGPFGAKFHRLSQDFQVQSPDFKGMMNIYDRLKKAERLTRGARDLVVVGSSFGGLLAALLYNSYPERFGGYVLMAPALHRGMGEEIEKMPEHCAVIHGAHDEVVDLQAVQQVCQRFGVEVEVVDDGHRLHDSLDRMAEATSEVLRRVQGSK